jgi:acetylornithine/N-succinyldiaminopimelate aminotransferase
MTLSQNLILPTATDEDRQVLTHRWHAVTEGLLAHVTRQGERLRRGIEALRHPRVSEVRGAGLLLGIALTEPVGARVQKAAQDAGFLVNAAGPTAVRLAPALNVPETQVDALVAALPGILDA